MELVIFPSFHRPSHIRCYNGNFKFPWPNLEQVTLPSPDALIIILGKAGATGKNEHFCVQIHDLLENKSECKLNHTKQRGVHIFKPPSKHQIVMSPIPFRPN